MKHCQVITAEPPAEKKLVTKNRHRFGSIRTGKRLAERERERDEKIKSWKAGGQRQRMRQRERWEVRKKALDGTNRRTEAARQLGQIQE